MNKNGPSFEEISTSSDCLFFCQCIFPYQQFFFVLQIVYILDQVRALESEMLLRIKQQGLNITPRILIVSLKYYLMFLLLSSLVLSSSRQESIKDMGSFDAVKAFF